MLPAGFGSIGSKHHIPDVSEKMPKWQCIDTPNWTNSQGLSCADYKSKGYCTGEGFAAGQEWTAGESYNYPEANCCSCLSAINVDSIPDVTIPYREGKDGKPAWVHHKHTGTKADDTSGGGGGGSSSSGSESSGGKTKDTNGSSGSSSKESDSAKGSSSGDSSSSKGGSKEGSPDPASR